MEATPTDSSVNSSNLRSVIAEVIEEAIAYGVDIVDGTGRINSAETAAVLAYHVTYHLSASVYMTSWS